MKWPSFSVCLLVCLAGCGSRMDLHSVTGTVKYEDGTVPEGEMATITFQPVNAMEGKAASSEIASDGTFELWTLDQGDGGALAGDYLVLLNITKGYPNRRHMVPREYADARSTPLKATVEPGKDNHFDFTVEKSKKK